MKLRFSLRAMLVLTTVVGLACLWRSRPARVADQFVRAVNAGDFDRADAMFRRGEHAFVAAFIDRDSRNRAAARVAPQSVKDWLLGSCRVDVELVDFEGLGATVQVAVPVDALGLNASRSSSDDSQFTGFFDPQINMER